MKLTKNMKSDFDAFLKEEGIYKEVNDIKKLKPIDQLKIFLCKYNVLNNNILIYSLKDEK